MSWDSELGSNGIVVVPPPAQNTSMQVTQQSAAGTLPGGQIQGPLTERIVVGNAQSPDAAIYLDVTNIDKAQQGMWAGSASFADAPFSVNLAGDVIATSVTLSGNFTAGPVNGQHIFIGSFAYGSGSVEGIQVFNPSGVEVGLIYGSNNGITMSDANAPGANSALTLDSSTGLAFLTGYNGLDISSQLGAITLSIGAGLPNTVTTISATGVNVNAGISVVPQIFSGTGTILNDRGAFIAFTGTSGGVLTLPSAQANGLGNSIIYFFADIGNNASTNSWDIAALGGEQINFAPTLTINVSGIGLTAISDGVASWYVVGLS